MCLGTPSGSASWSVCARSAGEDCLQLGGAEELEAAAEWYEAAQAGLGTDFLGEAIRAVAAISESATAWPIVIRKRNVRKFLLARFPYAVYYVPREHDILVLAVAHGSRRPGYWRHRLRG